MKKVLEREPFHQKLLRHLESCDSHVCVGLDTYYPWIPEQFQGLSQLKTVVGFNQKIIEQTHDLAAAYKLNIMLYLALGADGITAIRRTVRHIQSINPNIPIIADTKMSDMGSGIEAFWQLFFDDLDFDAAILTPWFGTDSFAEFGRRPERGGFVYVHDSNPTAPELQQLKLENGLQLYEHVAYMTTINWNRNQNMFVEVGATYPDQLKRVRRIVKDDAVIFTAGVGPQGGKAENLVGCFGKHGKRLLVNSSRPILFHGQEDSSYLVLVRRAANRLRRELNQFSSINPQERPHGKKP